MAVQDLITDNTTNDLVILGGDLVVGASDQQHVQHILTADRGQIRQFPFVGLGIAKNFNGVVNIAETKKSIRLQLKSDGYEVRQVIVTPDFQISIDAERIL